MEKATWKTCGGTEESEEHAMLDYCWYCAPWWGEFPTCPVHGNKLRKNEGKDQTRAWCKKCHKWYSLIKDNDMKNLNEVIGDEDRSDVIGDLVSEEVLKDPREIRLAAARAGAAGATKRRVERKQTMLDAIGEGLKEKEAIDNQPIQCSRFAGYVCRHAESDKCHCACGGKNHGKDRKEATV